MKHAILLITLVLLAVPSAVSAQTKSNEYGSDACMKCSQVLSTISHYWKLDSNANRGHRMLATQFLLSCSLDKISMQQVLTLLGKPSKIGEYREPNMKYLEYATNIDPDTMATRLNWGKNYYVQFDIDMVMNRVNVIRKGCHCE